MKCRFCNTDLEHLFIDLQNSPASNSFLTEAELDEPEIFYPLKVYTCHNCFLVQVDEYKKSGAIFSKDYAYFSSFSTSWLKHSKDYAEKMTSLLSLNSSSTVVELASNDGYLLQYFNEKGIPVLGVEPTANTAEVAIKRGIKTVVDFFGTRLANDLHKQGISVDLLLGNNVLAHVPDIKDFVAGMQIILKEDGVITMEFPHLLQLVLNNQFDTIYHEHFSYLSFQTVKKIFESQGLKLFDVEEISTHGGSLRIYATHLGNEKRPVSEAVEALLKKEASHGMLDISFYDHFQESAFRIKAELLKFLLDKKTEGKSIAGYGAAAKGNTLLNYCGIKSDMITMVADASPYKQGKYLPASHIPVTTEQSLIESKPDFVIIFPWNLKTEVMEQLSYIREWGGKFVIPIPALQIL